MNTINKKQLTAIAAIIVVGVLLSLSILRTDKTMTEADELVEEGSTAAKSACRGQYTS